MKPLAVVLAAGEGRRMGDISANWPKPLLPVLNVPVLVWTLDQLRGVGVSDAWANVRHLSRTLLAAKSHLEQASNVRLHLVPEDAPTGPAGGLLACLRRCPPSNEVVAVHGDVFVGEGYAGLLDAHRSSSADVTMLVTAVPDPSRFGAVTVVDGLLVDWAEKARDAKPGAYVNAGAYVLSPRAREVSRQYPHLDDCDFKDLLPWLASHGLIVRVHITDGLWSDIGTPESLASLNADLVGRAKWRTRAIPLLIEGSVYDAFENWIAISARVGTCTMYRVIVGADATIADHCHITESVVLAGAILPQGTVAHRAVLS